jgi:hypothetical protein
VMMIVAVRFGPVPPDVASSLRGLLQRVPIADVANRALKVTSLEELFATE